MEHCLELPLLTLPCTLDSVPVTVFVSTSPSSASCRIFSRGIFLCLDRAYAGGYMVCRMSRSNCEGMIEKYRSVPSAWIEL